MSISKGERRTFPERWAWALVALGIIFVAAIRIRLLSMPIERDEGEFGYMGQLILQGIPPYKLAYNMKFPGIYLAYALVLGIFGQSVAAIHIGVLIANTAAIILLFLLTKRLFDPLTGAIAAITFGLLSVSSSVLGIAGHATQYVLPFALGGILMLLKGLESRKTMSFVWSGLLLGIAILMKQHAAFFLAFAVIYLVVAGWRVLGKRTVGYAALLGFSSLVPFALTCIWLYSAGVFRNFWFWTFTYAREYVAQMPFREGINTFTVCSAAVVRPAPFVWLLAAAGLISIPWNGKARRHWVFIVGFSAFSFAAICPGMYFRIHYFVLLLPAVAMLTALAIASATVALGQCRHAPWLRIVPGIVLVSALFFAVVSDSGVYFRATPQEACRTTYNINPFPESVAIGEYIRAHSAKGDEVAILGSEPQIFFYARRHSATGFIYVYSLMESQPFASQMQGDMIREIEAAKPKFIVFTNVSMSWFNRFPDEETEILRWGNDYISSNYRAVGLLDIISTDYTADYWGDDAAYFVPQSPEDAYIYLYQRNGT